MDTRALPPTLGLLLAGSPASFPSTKGTLYLWEPAPRIVVSRVIGVLTGEGASAIEMAARRSCAKYGGYGVYHDWEGMTDYEPEARSRLVQVALDFYKVTDSIHIFATSKSVQLGLRAASVAVRWMTIHSKRSTLESALQRALAETRR